MCVPVCASVLVEGSALLPMHLSVYLCAHLCVSADVYSKMSFCTQWNHPLPILKFRGIINISSTWSPMVCCYSRPRCYADELNLVYWLEELEQLGWAGCV